ncbi:hypothetical protein SAMN06295905_1595 [Devosia lucknowensis]|uniref:Uncharacterized protein n=1 Tax=Devosia lucknowensis TaxID=1096929 RepID=A0A1Y6F5J1_9HYPH|nr:hypothetical protein [Devosia lucknowensis]SMQ68590.1 hypothetical protein SAMN06295905_1595 [Devosia lucknowensis]
MADFDKATAELPILRDFIDFVNKQSAVYMDSLAGFEGNTVRIGRQVHRVTRPDHIETKNGENVVVWTSAEDPSQPDVILSTIRRATDYLDDNSHGGFNEQQLCASIIVFIFAYWDEEVRPAIARVRGVEPNSIRIDAMGDLRILRNAIIHAGGMVAASEHAKLKKMADLPMPDKRLVLSHDQMHRLLVLVKQAIGEIIMHYTGALPGAPTAEKIVDVAIQNAGPRTGTGPKDRTSSGM